MRRNCPYCNNKPCVCPGYPVGPHNPKKPIGRPPMRPYEGDVFVFNWPHPPIPVGPLGNPIPRMKPRHKPIMFDPVPDPAPTLPGGK